LKKEEFRKWCLSIGATFMIGGILVACDLLFFNTDYIAKIGIALPWWNIALMFVKIGTDMYKGESKTLHLPKVKNEH